MGFKPVQLLTEPSFAAMRFDGSFADYAELAAAANDAIKNGALGRIDSKGFFAGDKEEYQVTLVTLEGKELPVYGSFWVVSISPSNEVEVYEDAPYRAKFTLPEGEE